MEPIAENQTSDTADPPGGGAIEYAGADRSGGRYPSRWGNRFAVIAAVTLLLIWGYRRLGDHDPPVHLLGWSFIFHRDRSMAIFTPGNSLFAIDLSGVTAAAVVASVVYLITWGIRQLIVFLSGR